MKQIDIKNVPRRTGGQGMRRRPPSAPAPTVDAYLRALPPAERTAFERLRRAIRAAAPKAEEVISYQIPTYKYMGPLVSFAAFRGHCSLYVVDKDILEKFGRQLQAFWTSGTTIHFSPDHPLPTGLVQAIVTSRVKKNEMKRAGRR